MLCSRLGPRPHFFSRYRHLARHPLALLRLTFLRIQRRPEPTSSCCATSYKNGSRACEKVRNEYTDGDWTRFNELVAAVWQPSLLEIRAIWVSTSYSLRFIPPNVVGQFHFKSEDAQRHLSLWKHCPMQRTHVRFSSHNCSQSEHAWHPS